MNIRSIYWYFYLASYVLLGSVGILWLRIRIRNKKSRRVRLQQMEKNWARAMLTASGAQVDVHYEEALKKDKSYVFFANHQSSFDIFTLLAYTAVPAVFVSKPLYFKIPIFGQAMKEMGHFSIDRTHKRQALADLQQAQQAIFKHKLALIMFPEGTRSIDGRIQSFKSTPLKVLTPIKNPHSTTKRIETTTAYDVAYIKIVPVTLIDTRNIQRKGSLKIYPASVKVVFGKPIPITANDLMGKAKHSFMKKIEATIRSTYHHYHAISQ